jgi:hypothetical protein
MGRRDRIDVSSWVTFVLRWQSEKCCKFQLSFIFAPVSFALFVVCLTTVSVIRTLQRPLRFHFGLRCWPTLLSTTSIKQALKSVSWESYSPLSRGTCDIISGLTTWPFWCFCAECSDCDIMDSVAGYLSRCTPTFREDMLTSWGWFWAEGQ